MKTETHASSTIRKTPSIGFRYDETAALYASQVVVNSLDGMILLESSSGFVRGDSGETVLPIDSRLAMSSDTARKLGNLLVEVADELDAVDAETSIEQISETWLRSAASLQSNLRRAVDKLPHWDN